MKRSAETEPQKRAKKVTAQAPKQSRPPELPPVACIISGLHADCKIAVARCLMQELGTNRVVALATDAEAAKQLAARPENKGKTIVCIIPSFGERYLSTVLYADLWAEATDQKAEPLE